MDASRHLEELRQKLVRLATRIGRRQAIEIDDRPTAADARHIERLVVERGLTELRRKS